MFKHVVVAVDFSPAWPRLQERLQALLPWGVERVALVHVLSSRYPATPEVRHRAHYDKRLGEKAERLATPGLVVDWQVRVGETSADLLLIGSRGYSRMAIVQQARQECLARSDVWKHRRGRVPQRRASGAAGARWRGRVNCRDRHS